MITFFTDTDCDFTPELAEKYGYKLISMPYSVGGKTVYPYVDFDEFDSHSFYEMLRGLKKEELPTTSALGKDKYIEYFEPEFKKGNDICYVHFSAKMTATFGFMQLALNELKEKYPDRKFYDIDTKGITICAFSIAQEIGELVLAGKSIEEIMAWSNVEIDKFATYFYANDLKFFRKSGRVSGLAAMFGTILGIRPLINMNQEGIMASIGKERGRENAVNAIIKTVEDLGENIKDHKIVIGHCDAQSDVDLVISKLEERFGKLDNIEVHPVNPTAGSHCGPDSLGVCFHAIHR